MIGFKAKQASDGLAEGDGAHTLLVQDELNLVVNALIAAIRRFVGQPICQTGTCGLHDTLNHVYRRVAVPFHHQVNVLPGNAGAACDDLDG